MRPENGMKMGWKGSRSALCRSTLQKYTNKSASPAVCAGLIPIPSAWRQRKKSITSSSQKKICQDCHGNEQQGNDRPSWQTHYQLFRVRFDEQQERRQQASKDVAAAWTESAQFKIKPEFIKNSQYLVSASSFELDLFDWKQEENHLQHASHSTQRRQMEACPSVLTICYYCAGCWRHFELLKEKKQNVKIDIRGYLTLIETTRKTDVSEIKGQFSAKGYLWYLGSNIWDSQSQIHLVWHKHRGLCFHTESEAHVQFGGRPGGKSDFWKEITQLAWRMSYFRAGVMESMWAWGWREQPRLAQRSSPICCRANQS